MNGDSSQSAAPVPCPAEETLLLLAAGAIEDRAARDHIARCPRCSAITAAHEADEAFAASLGPARFVSGPPAAAVAAADRPGEVIPSALAPADTIDGYDLLDEIARGGQGIVVRARQKATGRLVAIKMLSGGAAASTRALARFEREIEIAASLSHPGIVTVHTAARTARGGTALVMPFIEGRRLDQWAAAERDRMTPAAFSAAAAALIEQVATAAGYAHRRGVIHRDLKPSNVLVDDAGAARILDFGIARRSGPAASLTLTGEFSGTLAYAAPEQVTGKGDQVDVRTDVYALGLLLYELVAGRLPYAVEGSLSDMIASITTAPPPSLRGDRTLGVSRDLDTILATALAKDPDRRYATADALAADLAALRTGSAIAARRDSTAYVLRKAARAHWRPLTAAAAAVAVLAIALITLVVMADRAQDAAFEQAQQKIRAESEAVRSRAVSHVMRLLAPAGARFDAREEDPAAHDISMRLRTLEAAIDHGTYADEPQYEQALRTTLAALYEESVGLMGRGEVAARQVLSGAIRLHGPQHVAVAGARHTLGSVLLARKRPIEAEAEALAAAALRRTLLGSADEHTIASLELAAGAQLHQHKAAEALATLDAVAGDRATLPASLAVSLSVTRALALMSMGRAGEARAVAREALSLAAAALERHEVAFAAALRAADTCDLPAAEQIDLVRLADELEDRPSGTRRDTDVIGDVIGVRKAMLGPVHAAIGFELAALSWAATQAGEYARAAAAIEEAVPMLEAALGPTHPSMASLYDRLGTARWYIDAFASAADALSRCIDIWKAQPPGEVDLVSLAVQHRYVAHCLLLAGQPREAERAAREAIARLSVALGPEHYAVGMAGCVLAWARAEQGSIGEAVALARDGIALMDASDATPPDQRMLADAIMGLVLVADAKPDRGASLLEESMETFVRWKHDNGTLKPFMQAWTRARAEIGLPESDIARQYRQKRAPAEAVARDD